MQFSKRSLQAVSMPYALGTAELYGRTCVFGAPEDRGPLFLVPSPFDHSVPIAPGPGGCMAITGRPDREGELYCIMGCFLGYKFQGGGIYSVVREEDAHESWVMNRVIDLPFAHRIDFVTKGGVLYLVAASIAEDKAEPADWSKPGHVYAAAVPRSPDDSWSLTPILRGLHKNHGFRVGSYLGRPAVLVSGVEGLFAIWLDDASGGWPVDRLVEREISEFSLIDLDGDGLDELITIEPFHGSRLAVYRREDGRWIDAAWEEELAYGHCLWTGTIQGGASILVSNRSGSRNLSLYRFRESTGGPKGRLQPERIVVDEGVGAANMVVVGDRGTETIVAANQATSEIAAYVVS